MTVAPASPENIDAIVALLEEMDRFYGATDIESLDVRIRQVQQALFSDMLGACALLAWEDDRLVGIASYSFLWPAVGLSRSLYLKELYVSQEQRRTGVGAALMQGLLEIAAKHECSRVEWTTDKDNVAAQRFYEKLGLLKLPTKLFYRADGEVIDQQLH